MLPPLDNTSSVTLSPRNSSRPETRLAAEEPTGVEHIPPPELPPHVNRTLMVGQDTIIDDAWLRSTPEQSTVAQKARTWVSAVLITVLVGWVAGRK